MNYKPHLIAVDHFGVASAHMLLSLLKQDSDRRKRKVAFNDLLRLAKLSKVVGEKTSISFIGLSTNKGGVVEILFLEEEKVVESAPLTLPSSDSDLVSISLLEWLDTQKKAKDWDEATEKGKWIPVGIECWDRIREERLAARDNLEKLKEEIEELKKYLTEIQLTEQPFAANFRSLILDKLEAL